MKNRILNVFKQDNKYSFIKIFNFILMNVFRAILLFMLIDAIITGNKDRIVLVVLTSLTSFYREYIRLFTKVKISDGMQIITTTFIILTALFGTLMGVYDTIKWWDTLLHVISGILLTFFGLMILAVMKDKDKNLRYKTSLIILFAFLFSMTAGTIWEIMEFSADTFLGMDAQRSQPPATNGVLDTMIDIVANTVGTIITVIPLYFYFRKKDEEQMYTILDDWFIVPKDKNKTKVKSKTKKENKQIKNKNTKL